MICMLKPLDDSKQPTAEQRGQSSNVVSLLCRGHAESCSGGHSPGSSKTPSWRDRFGAPVKARRPHKAVNVTQEPIRIVEVD
jgi:hypothetical protein